MIPTQYFNLLKQNRYKYIKHFTTRLIVQKLIQFNNKENIKASRN